MKVSLFITCLADQFYPQVGVSVVRLLQRFGCEVDFPADQTCCGQPAFNSGYVNDARKAAKNHVLAFKNAEYVVSPSGSCTSMIHHYYRELFSGDKVMESEVDAFISKSYEFTQFLVNMLKVREIPGSFPHSVTYHPACHGARLLGVRTEPLELLRSVADLTLVDLPRSQDCCGFGGAFAVKMSDISGAMLNEKVEHIAETKCEYVVSTDLGCLMNIGGQIKRRPSSPIPIHIAELLDTAMSGGTPR